MQLIIVFLWAQRRGKNPRVQKSAFDVKKTFFKVRAHASKREGETLKVNVLFSNRKCRALQENPDIQMLQLIEA